MSRTLNRRGGVAVAAGLLLGAIAAVSQGPAAAQPPGGGAVEVRVVNYQQLGAAVKQHKGKVVVIDVWRRD